MRVDDLLVHLVDRAKRNATACVWGIAGLCFALRVIGLGEKSLWVDEIWSLRIARLPWHSLGWVIANQDPNSSVYYALLHFWVRLGDTEIVIRMMSVLFATATIPVVYLIGRRLMGIAAGLTASFLVSINIFHIQWSQETRGYALLVFAIALASLLFVRSIESPGVMNWTGYAVVLTLSIYVHLFAALVLVAHWVSVIFLRPRDVPWRGLVWSSASIGICASPLLYLVFLRSRAPMFPPDWLPKISGWILYISASQMAGNAYYPDSSDRYSVMLLIVSMALCLLALLAWGECFRAERSSIKPWRLGVLWCWLIIPPALMLAASMIQPMFVFRYLLVSLPAMALVTAAGVARLRPNWASLLTILLIVSLGSPGLIRYYRYRSGFQEWRAVASTMLANSRPGDGAIFCIAPGRLLVDYYGEQMHATAMPEPVYPAFLGFDQDPRALDYLPSWTDDDLKAAASSHDRMWLILYHDFFGTTQHARDHLKVILESAYSQSDTVRIDGVTLSLYTRAVPKEAHAHPSDQIASENSKPPARRDRN